MQTFLFKVTDGFLPNVADRGWVLNYISFLITSEIKNNNFSFFVFVNYPLFTKYETFSDITSVCQMIIKIFAHSRSSTIGLLQIR
jgi:hypothetical protein